MKGKRRSKAKVAVMTHVTEANAAGIDVGSTEMYVAVPPDRDEQSVRRFATFTADLIRLAEWLKQCGITSVAMESTSVFWIPLFQILEEHGFRVCLVNARHVKNVPGRKTDVLDCQWLQYLHSVGLLRASHRPSQSICALRSIWRHRESLIGRSTHSAHAKGARPDESTTAPRDQRYNRHHRNGYRGCHPGWRTRSSKAIRTAQ